MRYVVGWVLKKPEKKHPYFTFYIYEVDRMIAFSLYGSGLLKLLIEFVVYNMGMPYWE